MASVNKVILVGNLGRDPEMRFTNNQTPVANMSIATTEKWRNNSGEMAEKTEWHRVVVFGKVAESCAKYLSKGSSVYIEGRISTRSWDDVKTGTKRYQTEIIAETVQFLNSKRSNEAEPAATEVPEEPVGYEDVPF